MVYLFIHYYNKHHLLVFNEIFKKLNEIQLTKNKIDLNNRKFLNLTVL